MVDYLTPIVTAKEIADEQRYGEEEYENIKGLVLASQALLFNAQAFIPDNPLTAYAVKAIVGHWLENRDHMNYDYKSVMRNSVGLTSIITTLQYFRTDHLPEEDDDDEES